jgi:O-antigen/teichoic acid export membrane protein
VHRVFLIRRFMRFSASRATLRDGFRTLPGLIRFGLQITPGALADGGSNASGTWIVASFSTIGAVGAYGRAYSLVSQLSLLNTRTNEMLFPTLLERRAKEDGAGYARALVDSLRYATIALVIPAAAAAGVADSIMHVFGPGFEQGAPALAILLFSPPLLSLTQMQRQALYSLDRPVLGSVSGLLRFAVTIVAGVLLTWKIGATGAAIAFILGLLVDFAFATRLVVRNLATPFLELWPPRQFVALVAACAGSYACSRIIDAVLPFPLNILFGVGVGMLAFVAILISGGGVDTRDRERLQDLRRLVAQRRARPAPTAEGARGREVGNPGAAR